MENKHFVVQIQAIDYGYSKKGTLQKKTLQYRRL